MSSLEQLANALTDIKASQAAGRLAHAYLVVGSPRGDGLSLARSIAQLVLCRDMAPPCGSCRDCETVVGRTHPDVYWLEPEKKSRIIGIDAIREINGHLAQKSFAGGWKVAVLLHADRLNQDGANAFLKTLEEPPPRTLILLVTDAPQGMLATIVSRCQRVQLAAGDRPVEASWSESLLELLARPLGGGVVERMGRAREMQALLDAERKRIEKEVDAELKQSEEGENIDKEVREARIESQARQVRADMLHTMLLWRRDLLVLASGGEGRLLQFPGREPQLRQLVGRLGADQAMRLVRGMSDLVRRLDRNIKPEAVAYEALLLDSAN